MLKFVFYFIFWRVGGLITDLKLSNFVIKHQITTIIQNSLTEHIYFTNKAINLAVSDISSEFRGHK